MKKQKGKKILALLTAICSLSTTFIFPEAFEFSVSAEETHVTGDANEDGELNVRDAAFIANKFAKRMGDLLPEWADFNGDDNVNVRDAAAIAHYLAYPLSTSTVSTVTFYMNDKTNAVHQTVSVITDEMVEEPVVPTRDGYTFGGWYEDAACKEPYDFDLLVMEDIDLYAQWNHPGPYSVTFDSAGGSYIPNQTVYEDQPVTEPKDPKRDGYVFIGWLDEYNEYFEFDEILNKDIALTAEWVRKSEITQDIEDILGTYLKTNETLIENDCITSVNISGESEDAYKVVASEINSGPLLSIPGYLTAVDINALGGTISDAVITFQYDPEQLEDDDISPEELGIVWYDETNDTVVLLDSKVDTDNNNVYVSTDHFSKYAVVNVTEWMESQNTKLPTIRTEETPYYSIILAMDCSGSMSGDKMSKSIVAAQDMIDVLADEDRVTLLAFEDSTQTVFEQVQLVSTDENDITVDNRDMIKEQIASLYADGGTDIESVLESALECKSNDAQYQSFVILLSDGQSSVSDSVLNSLKENGQRVISVGVGSDVDSYLMQNIADVTEGTYLFCENANDLAAAFKSLQDAYIGSTVDTDNDGLPDSVETTGMRDQYGEIWMTDPNKDDTDDDGISDGEEMGLYYPLAQPPYFQRVSRPDMYTINSSEAYLLMPDNMMSAVDVDNNKIKLEVYISDAGYRMVPDLLTPPDPDGISKEYIYSSPKNLNVNLSGLPDGVVIDSLKTVNEGVISGTMTTSYKTTAILSYTKNVTLDNVTWIVTADNCSEWTGFAEEEIKAKYIKKTQSVQKTKVELPDAEQAKLNLAQASLDIVNKLYSNAKNETADNIEYTRANVKNMMHLSARCHKEDVIPDGMYDAFALAILHSLEKSELEKYETKPNKMANQIYSQIKGGLSNGNKKAVEKVDGIQYKVTYKIYAEYGLAVGSQTISWHDSNGSHWATLTWENVSSRNGLNALADYCAALAQLNQDVWTDFMSYYVSDAFGLMGIKTVTKKNVDKVFAVTEKTIKALCNKYDADALIKEMGEGIEEKLKSGLTNKFKSFIKDNVPNGDKIVKAAEQYKKIKDKYDEFQKFVSASDNEKAVKAFEEFQKAYNKLDVFIESM